jgi:hypothetical protein
MDGNPARPASPRPGEGGGEYTDRPSKEVPEEGGATRDEDQESVERTGESDDAKRVRGGDPPDSGS